MGCGAFHNKSKKRTMATIKGQNLRILLAGEDDGDVKCVAAATNCNAHVALELAEDTTKDTEDDWVSYMPVGLSWDVQVDSLILDSLDQNAKQTERLKVGNVYALMFSQTAIAAGSYNRKSINSNINFAGYAILSDLQITATNQDISQAKATFTGTGDLAFVPKKIEEWVKSQSWITDFMGIGSIEVNGTPYAVAIGKDSDHNTQYVFPLSHDGAAAQVVATLSVVDDINDYSHMSESLFNDIINAASSAGYVGDTYPGGVYQYPVVEATGIIGETYVGVLNS